MSTLLTDAFGTDGLDYADECRAVIQIGGILSDAFQYGIDLLQEIEDGFTPPDIRLTQPDFRVDPERLLAECRTTFFCSTGAYNDLCHRSGKLVSQHGILNANAHGLYNHMKYFATACIPIGKAEDWLLNAEFDKRA
jgi:hypothetical protein